MRSNFQILMRLTVLSVFLLLFLLGCSEGNEKPIEKPAAVNTEEFPSITRTSSSSLGSITTSSSGIHVSGSGSVVVEPDITILSLATETINRSLSNAASQNARTTNKILSILRSNNVTLDDIKTQRYSTQPVYKYTQQEGQKLQGYKVTNSLQVTLRSVDESIGSVIDELAAVSGSDDLRINQISFQKEDTSDAIRKARVLAAQNAIEIADLYAKEMGVKRGPLLYVVDQNSSQYPQKEMAVMADMARSAPTPILAGDYNVQVTIRAVFGIN